MMATDTPFLLAHKSDFVAQGDTELYFVVLCGLVSFFRISFLFMYFHFHMSLSFNVETFPHSVAKKKTKQQLM